MPTTQSQPDNPTPGTMTNRSLLQPVVRDVDPRIAPELADDIVAMPMTSPDFIDVPLVNKNLAARWMFTDRRRYSQAIAQGWRNANQKDVAPGHLSPYSVEGGTKFINGDLILMVIDRKRYLGALRYKHQVAAAYADAAMQKTLSARQAVNELGDQAAAVNRNRMAQGKDPVLSVFTPGASEVKGPLGDPAVAGKEMARIGNAPRDVGTLADLAKSPKP